MSKLLPCFRHILFTLFTLFTYINLFFIQLFEVKVTIGMKKSWISLFFYISWMNVVRVVIYSNIRIFSTQNVNNWLPGEIPILYWLFSYLNWSMGNEVCCSNIFGNSTLLQPFSAFHFRRHSSFLRFSVPLTFLKYFIKYIFKNNIHQQQH